MPAKRIIPCLDVKDGRVVKGTNFINLKDAGDAVELAALYSGQGADELVFLDISASAERRKTLRDFVEKTARVISIPFTVGGGISTLADIESVLRAGADKVSLNTSIVQNPEFITEASRQFGSQAIVAAVDVLQSASGYEVYIRGGRDKTELEGIAWCKRCEELGAGELLVTAMHCDGTRNGYDINLLKILSNECSVPVIASGGAGSVNDFVVAFNEGNADACLAAGIFHYGDIPLPALKNELKLQGIEIR
ncbi:MAG: imidazole glycerol phosphate synthase subunit HisF [Ignavibacteria bacterium]|nr:imidazole glycerol phosphate synthase subunit HisF [Ignavibacteria bacterium]